MLCNSVIWSTCDSQDIRGLGRVNTFGALFCVIWVLLQYVSSLAAAAAAAVAAALIFEQLVVTCGSFCKLKICSSGFRSVVLPSIPLTFTCSAPRADGHTGEDVFI